LVSDLPSWQEYHDRTKLQGTRGSGRNLAHVTLVESVRQDRPQGLTIFDQAFHVRRGRETVVHRFSLSFRTVSVDAMTTRLERAGFAVSAVLGDYDGGPWDSRADVWLILATRLGTRGNRMAGTLR
jgi:hypothetical protein